jgi:hypothetical protein
MTATGFLRHLLEDNLEPVSITICWVLKCSGNSMWGDNDNGLLPSHGEGYQRQILCMGDSAHCRDSPEEREPPWEQWPWLGTMVKWQMQLPSCHCHFFPPWTQLCITMCIINVHIIETKIIVYFMSWIKARLFHSLNQILNQEVT